ncbi:MAG: class I SAM-dependent rRNA methyltransferase [Deltaproteobacteria bacterium]|nr:class I SAM-dependent rRNA methyltransferase [Deltaproteobacteria bacterium]
MVKNNKVIVSDRGRHRVLSGHKWIFRSDILEDNSNNSDIVFLFDKRKQFLGTALYSKNSQISLRVISENEIGDIEEYIQNSLVSSYKYRETLGLIGDCMRIVNSESDGLPGLIIDKYADTIVFQVLIHPMENLKNVLIKKIIDVLEPVQVFEKNDSGARKVEQLPEIVGTVYGKDRQNLYCSENHLTFYIDLVNSQKTSEFLDQKINRLIIGRKGFGRVLDLFCYHGWFGCNLRNYDELILVDTSSNALKIAEKNLIINQKKNFKLIELNVFDFLRELEKRGERFDTIILDPPSFIKNKKDIKRGYAGYKEINLRAMKILKKNGIMATFSCSYHMSDEEFQMMLRDAATDAKAEFIIKEYLRQSPDHKEILGFSESHYLKGFILEKIS